MRALAAPSAPRERNWLPMAIAAGVAVLAVALALLFTSRPKPTAAPVGAAPDPYAANLSIGGLALSESSNISGGKVTYIDGRIANHGSRTVKEVTVQVIFRNYAQEVAQNQSVPMTLIGMREPYIDTIPVSQSPIAPGAERDFRLIFDSVSPDWAGSMPELKIVQVELK